LLGTNKRRLRNNRFYLFSRSILLPYRKSKTFTRRALFLHTLYSGYILSGIPVTAINVRLRSPTVSVCFNRSYTLVVFTLVSAYMHVVKFYTYTYTFGRTLRTRMSSMCTRIHSTPISLRLAR